MSGHFSLARHPIVVPGLLMVLLLIAACVPKSGPTPTVLSPPTPQVSPTSPVSIATLSPTQAFLTPIPPVPPTQLSSNEVQAWIGPVQGPISPGDPIELIVFVAPGSFGVSSGEANLYLDENAFEVLDVVPGTLLGPQPLVGFKQIDKVHGTVKVAIARVGNTPLPSPQGQFAIVKALTKPNTPLGEHEIRLDISLADQEFNSLKVQVSGIKLLVGS